MSNLIEKLRSWATGYISPSAGMLMDEAATKIIELEDEIEKLEKDNDNLKTELAYAQREIDELKTPKKKTKK